MDRLTAFLSLALLVLAVSAQRGSRRPQKNVSKGDGRIVGGVESTIERYPYIVALLNSRTGEPFCGGSIISSAWILTAAHCTIDLTPDLINVVAGTTDLKRETSATQKRRVRAIINHPEYVRRAHDNDVGLLRLDTPLQLNSVVKVVQLDHNEFSPHDYLFVAGWGITDYYNQKPSYILKATSIPGVSRDECRRRYFDSMITNNMICAGFDEGGNSACHGDSGGPAVAFDTQKQVGIVSWGRRGCTVPGFPGVYVNVARYLPWIQTLTGLSL